MSQNVIAVTLGSGIIYVSDANGIKTPHNVNVLLTDATLTGVLNWANGLTTKAIKIGSLSSITPGSGAIMSASVTRILEVHGDDNNTARAGGTLNRTILGRLMIYANSACEDWGIHGLSKMSGVAKTANVSAGVVGAFEAIGTCSTATGSGNTIVAGVMGRIGVGTGFTLGSGTHAACVLAFGNNQNATPFSGSYFVGFLATVTDVGTAQVFDFGMLIKDSVATVGIAIGACTTGIDIAPIASGTITTGIDFGTVVTGIKFTGTITGNGIDFSSITIVPSGSAGTALLRAGVYSDDGATCSTWVSNTTDAQGGLIRFYAVTKHQSSTQYDRGIFVAMVTTGTKGIYPIAGLAEVRSSASAYPKTVGAAQFIADLHTATSKVAARAAAGWANFYGVWAKVGSAVGSEAQSGSVVAAIWLDVQMNGTVSGEIYSAYITTGVTVDAVFGFERTGGGGSWTYLFSFDDTCYNVAPVSALACNTDGGNSSGSLVFALNGVAKYIPYFDTAS